MSINPPEVNYQPSPNVGLCRRCEEPVHEEDAVYLFAGEADKVWHRWQCSDAELDTWECETCERPYGSHPDGEPCEGGR